MRCTLSCALRYSIGTKRWDGVNVSIGYTAHIGSKEIEVDNQISSREMPAVSGTSAEHENDLEFGSPPQTQAQRSYSSPLVVQAKKASVEKKKHVESVPEQSTTKPYVPSTSFYAQPPPKPKPKGPL